MHVDLCALDILQISITAQLPAVKGLRTQGQGSGVHSLQPHRFFLFVLSIIFSKSRRIILYRSSRTKISWTWTLCTVNRAIRTR